MILAADIPASLRPAAEAGLVWVNREHGTRYSLTGLVDVDEEIGEGNGELGLVLCDGELCVREQVRIQRFDEGFRINTVEAGPSQIRAHLDPPPGVRAGWLERQLTEHAFVVLLFYRGLW